MDLVTTRVPTTRFPWRQIGVLALLALLIAAALALYAGSQQQRLPAPFGPAANGAIAYSNGGDIYTADPETGLAKALVAGPEMDVGPRFSRDGTKILFERKLEGSKSELYVARADGGGITLVTPERVQLTPSILGEPWEQFQFSPDGQTLLIAAIHEGLPSIVLAPSDGGGLHRLDVGRAAYEPSFRPPDAAEILFVGDGPSGTWHGICRRSCQQDRPDNHRAVEHIRPGRANWSPDGSRIAYCLGRSYFGHNGTHPRHLGRWDRAPRARRPARRSMDGWL
jgi:dipeptidyl aminopeptidase/acylaminoacyl peptidase